MLSESLTSGSLQDYHHTGQRDFFTSLLKPLCGVRHTVPIAMREWKLAVQKTLHQTHGWALGACGFPNVEYMCNRWFER